MTNTCEKVLLEAVDAMVNVHGICFLLALDSHATAILQSFYCILNTSTYRRTKATRHKGEKKNPAHSWIDSSVVYSLKGTEPNSAFALQGDIFIPKRLTFMQL